MEKNWKLVWMTAMLLTAHCFGTPVLPPPAAAPTLGPIPHQKAAPSEDKELPQRGEQLATRELSILAHNLHPLGTDYDFKQQVAILPTAEEHERLRRNILLELQKRQSYGGGGTGYGATGYGSTSGGYGSSGGYSGSGSYGGTYPQPSMPMPSQHHMPMMGGFMPGLGLGGLGMGLGGLGGLGLLGMGGLGLGLPFGMGGLGLGLGLGGLGGLGLLGLGLPFGGLGLLGLGGLGFGGLGLGLGGLGIGGLGLGLGGLGLGGLGLAGLGGTVVKKEKIIKTKKNCRGCSDESDDEEYRRRR